ncbi:MAG: DUF115 domain-containing protein, partial [Acidobacteriota bacterium]|nr:DUF115 domain-containing protein [Acidobacteriota bacterium]
MDYFKANLAALAKRQPELAAALESADRSHIKTFPSADGAPAATVERTDATVAVHSRYNPLREARQALKQQSVAGSDYFIILGFGLGYLLDVVIEQTEQAEQTVQADCHYFVVEEDLGMLRAAFEVRDLTSLLAAHDVYFAWPTSGPELAEQWRRRFDVALARKSTYVIHPPSAALHPDFYKFAAETLQGAIYQITADITTLATKSQVYLDNFILNYPKAVAAPGINTFAGRFPNTPAVIVSAGPSLDKNIHELKGREDHILVVATDTSLKPLLAAGVEPHFVMTGDPSHANYLHLAGATTKDALLVMEATTHPQSADLFPGRVLSCTYEKSILTTLSGLLGDKGVLDVWGSVATMALDFALLLGCDPVIFIGQDLAYTGGRLYCSGVYFEKEWFKDVTTPEQREARLAALRAGNHPQLFDDIHGEPVETTKALIAYRNWILKVVG